MTRHEAVTEAMDDIRRLEADVGVTRAGVGAIRDRLIELSERRDLFPLDDFPPPHDGLSTMYRLAQDDDDRFALYVQSSAGTYDVPPHNHTTWAVVVGYHGHELNRFYERTAQGADRTGEFDVSAGTGVAMLPDDVHSIHLDAPALNFHCYGLALERLDRREYLSGDGTWRVFPPVTNIVDARAR